MNSNPFYTPLQNLFPMEFSGTWKRLRNSTFLLHSLPACAVATPPHFTEHKGKAWQSDEALIVEDLVCDQPRSPNIHK